MPQQKRDRRTKAQGHRKGAVTRRIENAGGASAATVNERRLQQQLWFGTAEDPQGAVGGAAKGGPEAATHAVPKPKHKELKATSATMEEVGERLTYALAKVVSNKGAPGPDRQSIKQVQEHWPELEPVLRTALDNGTYEPGDIRRVWIPKANGGQRGLGIPNVVDRVVQEAVRMVLEPLYEPTFHEASHGFRPGRSCHTAIKSACTHLEEGFDWVVDLDLEKFFDRVNHQQLMARLAQRVENQALLRLIGKMLKAKVVMPDGVVVSTEEGVPQGGPLSPLLSHIVLDELDQELARRGHRFVRYADNANIYVRSERAGQRAMTSITAFIEKRIRLQVNAAKSAVARPEERHFLGFRLKREPLGGRVEVLLSTRTQERLDQRIRELTPRNWGQSLTECIKKVNVYLVGWMGFFAICTAGVESELKARDAHIRRRLRAILLTHWKTKRTIARRLIRLGVKRATAWRITYAGRQSRWAMSCNSAVHQGLRNAYFADRGLVSLVERWAQLARYIGAPGGAAKAPTGIG
ncbi:MAG: group II intron reverse transcriptase/maturase [Planctomycetota bacterium]